MAVLLIGTLDTKGVEYQYVCERLRAAGVEVIVADAGVLQPPAFPPDIPRETVFAAAGEDYQQLRRAGDRGQAVAAAARGAAAIARQLYADGRLSGIMGLGGSAGTTIATAAMRALPLGVPKLMISTLASGQVQPFVGTRDILMMHAVVDISGVNRISRQVFDNAVAAMAGMHAAYERRKAAPAATDRPPTIAATMFGVTTPCVEAARRILEAEGYEVLVFHATGTGGRTMEELIHDGHIAGVLDITTTELADELVGGILTAGPNRLTAAAMVGIPQVVSVGALDMVNFGPPQTVPPQFAGRRMYQHNPNVTLMRTTPQEMDRLGKELAEKTSAARGPTALVLPLRGVSALDIEGGPFWDPQADAALFQSIRNWIAPHVRLIELDLHINDPAFAQACAAELLAMLKQALPSKVSPHG